MSSSAVASKCESSDLGLIGIERDDLDFRLVAKQIELATYQLVFREYFYNQPKKQLPLPPDALWNVTITNDYHPVFAGGLWTPWAVELKNSTVSNNTVVGAFGNGNGGGIAGNTLVPLNISRSTFSGNSAQLLFGRAPGPEGSSDIYVTNR